MKKMKNTLPLFLAACVTAVGAIVGTENVTAAHIEPREHVIYAEEKTHWITNSSGIRHNKSCRYYRNSKGRACTKNEGRACKKCGG
ncbi:hypothetical protein ACFPK9_01130 [Rubritalea spongiae]|uniref:hypothetical protein n=1 Tax=Rubritalea spongiae TaxID=430797 RepID=UPI00360A1AB4